MPTAMPSAVMSGPSTLSVGVGSNDFEVGSPRVPFVLLRGTSPVMDAQVIDVAAFDLSSGTPVRGWLGSATSYSDYEIPYWVVYPELPHAGFWGISAIVTLSDGSQTHAQFTLETVNDPAAPTVGETPPASVNRTLASVPDLAKLTSDAEPEPALYQITVADALKSGIPTVITFATPGYCTSRLCAPVVDSVKDVYHDLQGQANFIHLEIYKSFDPLEYGDEWFAWGLISEPWTFVLDRGGRIVARLGGPVSPRELTAVLQPLVGP